MNRFENDRRKKIYEIIVVIKTLSIFLGAIAVFSHMDIQKQNWLHFQQSIFICIMLFGAVYQIWKSTVANTQIVDRITLRFVIEGIFLTLINIGIVLFTGGYASQYKFLFLFNILAATMQFGMKWGMIIAVVSSFSIAVIDIFSLPMNQPNLYFESDLVVISIFFMTSWLLGYYVKTENYFRKILSNAANIDELTGLFNHRYFQQYLNDQLERAAAGPKPISLLFADLDYFKYYNDVYGHQTGDQVLIQVSGIIEKAVGTKGMAARYGGEEFAVVLPGIDEKTAIGIAEEIRSQIEAHPFVGAENQPGGKMTISIGVSSFPDRAQTKSELISTADEALYKAKFISKNKVEVYFSVLDGLKNELDTEHIDLISSIKTLISVINAKDRYTYGHTERVVQYCQIIGSAMDLPEKDMKVLQHGAYLHDIGKIEIPKELLNKKSRLTEEEWNILRQHPVNGAEIIKPVNSLKGAVPLILYHHERLDGKGYPEGIQGIGIPRLVRILSIADAFDAMTTSRPYKKRKTLDEAFDELRRCSGSQFDGDIVEIFIKEIKRHSDQFYNLMVEGF